MQRKSSRLGRGIDALLGDLDLVETQNPQDGNLLIRPVPISLIIPNEDQPRKYFEEQSLQELANSIRQQGILQPILVEKFEGFYRVVAGERRFRAAKIAQLKNVPVIIREFNNEDRLIVSLIENVQRENISPIEEAITYKRLIKISNLSQQEMADRLGKSRSTVANSLRLLNLPDEVQNVLQQGLLSAGHARALLALDDSQEQRLFLEEVLNKKVSVRDLENRIRGTREKEKPKSSSLSEGEAKIINTLTEFFESPVLMRKDKNGRSGYIKIHFSEKARLEEIAGYLKNYLSKGI